MGILGFIPARGGSKGVKNKHLLPLLNKEVILYTIDTARLSKQIDKIVVSTDSDVIAKLCSDYGCEVIHRPAELALDVSPIEDAWRHAVEYLRTQGFKTEILVNLYGNVPVRSNDIIDRVVDKIKETKADIVRTYTEVGKYHPAWMLSLNAQGDISPFYGVGNQAFRRQDLAPAYIHDGAVDATRVETLFNPSIPFRGAFNQYNEVIKGVIQKQGETVEIDTELDVAIAEAILKRRSQVKNVGN